MAKQEKIILGLKCHSFSEYGCDDCPYNELFGVDNMTCVQHLTIDAIDLLKEQEARALTIDGIETLHKGSDVFIERRGLDFILPATVFRVGRNFIEFYGNPMSERFDRYNRFWRLWTNRPTDEKRKEAEWDAN